jgi:hypothetical protein
LESKEGELLWPVAEAADPLSTGADTWQHLSALLNKVVTVLSTDAKFPELTTLWTEEALTWAAGCTQIVQAVRSCQIFRAVNRSFSPDHVVTIVESMVPLLDTDNT